MRVPGGGFGGTALLYVGFGLAAVAAAYVFVAIQPEPTMFLPPILAALPLGASNGLQSRVLRIVSAALLAAFGLAGILSVGILFFPASVVLAVSVLLVRRDPDDSL